MTTKNQTEIIDEMVRDFCSVVPRPKSEVRRRIEDLLTASNLRILSAVEEWAREHSYELNEVLTEKVVSLSDLTSALQEARSNIK